MLNLWMSWENLCPIYDNNNENIYMLVYKKSLKKCLCLFHKTFSNCQATYQKELNLLFEKSGNKHRDRFDSSPPPVCLHSLFKDPPSPHHDKPRVSTGVENMRGGGGALQNLMGGLKSIHGGSMGGLKCCRKIPVKEFI